MPVFQAILTDIDVVTKIKPYINDPSYFSIVGVKTMISEINYALTLNYRLMIDFTEDVEDLKRVNDLVLAPMSTRFNCAIKVEDNEIEPIDITDWVELGTLSGKGKGEKWVSYQQYVERVYIELALPENRLDYISEYKEPFVDDPMFIAVENKFVMRAKI